jgi:hypothetical protein
MEEFHGGMWISDGKSVGVYYVPTTTAAGTAAKNAVPEIHIVDPKTGDTAKIVKTVEPAEDPDEEPTNILQEGGWRKATFEEIPEKRRPAPEVAHKYGYALPPEQAAEVQKAMDDAQREQKIEALKAEIAELEKAKAAKPTPGPDEDQDDAEEETPKAARTSRKARG